MELRMVRLAAGLLLLALAGLAPAFAQPATTRPNISNMLAQCSANTPVVGNGAGSSPICHPSGALGTAAFANIGTSGGTIGLLNAANTYSATQAFAAITATTINGYTFTPGTGTVAFGAGGTIGPVGYSTAGQIPGVASNSSASTGNVGEVISANVSNGSPTSLTTGSPINLVSISLTAGDWDVWAQVNFVPAATTNITRIYSSISAVSGSPAVGPGQLADFGISAGFVPGSIFPSLSITPFQVQLNSTTPYYLVVNCTFTVSTCGAYGVLRARRMR
jgi:hypothetical protein